MKMRVELYKRNYLNRILLIVFVVLLVQCSERKPITKNQSIDIIPQPVKVEQLEGEFIIDERTSLRGIGGAEATTVATYLATLISEASTFDISVEDDTLRNEKQSIVLEIADSGKKESYSLNVAKDQIYIKATDAVGLFYGVQTLRQLLPPAIEIKNKINKAWVIPVVAIQDEPAFAWRGMHLDVSRHFFSVDFIKQFIDRLAFYKFNTFHLHLTDDQGWRIEIKKYPQLTEQGAWRVFNDQDSVCMEKSITNPDFALPAQFLRGEGSNQMYGGYYTQEEIKEIVTYASDHFVTIIPEIDMPGHMKAALNSFSELSCVDGSGWGKIFSIPLCPCEESTYTFVENVLDEIVPLFPGEYIHIGADEVDKITWAKAKSCTDLMPKEGLKEVDELQGYFVRRIEKYLRSKGKKMIGWDEVLDGGVDSTTTVMYWRGWIPEAPIKAANEGHDVIMSPTSHCYFDYVPDNTTLEHTYSFNPIPDHLAADKEYKIIGLQANIWTEWIPTVSRLDYMTMPRMMALSEVAWTSNKNFVDFKERLKAHYKRLDILKIKYRLPDIPNVKEHVVFTEKQNLILEKPDGVFSIRYTTDGSVPDSSSKLYEQPIEVDSSVTFTVQTFGAEGRSGNTYTIRMEKQQYSEAVIEANIQKGLVCRYYEGTYSSVTKISERDFKKQVYVDEVVIPSFCREDNFALQLNGLISIPEDGIYTFYLSSDDGSVLQVDDRTVINNDGYHGSKETSGQAALKKGNHIIRLAYFESSGGNSLSLQYEGPGVSKQKIPPSALNTPK